MIAAVDLVRETAMEMRISVGFAHTIAAEEEHYRKVCVWWIPRRNPEINDDEMCVLCLLHGTSKTHDYGR